PRSHVRGGDHTWLSPKRTAAVGPASPSAPDPDRTDHLSKPSGHFTCQQHRPANRPNRRPCPLAAPARRPPPCAPQRIRSGRGGAGGWEGWGRDFAPALDTTPRLLWRARRSRRPTALAAPKGKIRGGGAVGNDPFGGGHETRPSPRHSLLRCGLAREGEG